MLALNTHNSALSGHAGPVIRGDARTGREVPIGPIQGVLAVIDEVPGDMALAIVEFRSGENGHIPRETVDGCSGGMRDAAGSLDALKVVAMLSVLCKSILRIDLHALH